jgi:hypothetical protein
VSRRHLALWLITLCLTAGALEGILALASVVSVQVRRVLAPPGQEPAPVAALPDARLGHRPSPDYPGHDRRGFRNPEALEQADLVVLGDSQSYGAGVDPGLEWPRQLARASGLRLYNLAYGGYGPAHHLLLWEEAMRLRPSTVLVAFYTGNDLFDAFDLVYTRGQLPELRAKDPAVLAAVRSAEEAEPLAARVSRLFTFGTPEPAPLPPVRGFFSRHSRLYALARRTRHELTARLNPPAAPDPWEAAVAFARAHPDHCRVFQRGPHRTVFTPGYRFSVLDPSDPRVREGERIAVEVMREMQARAAAAGARFLVVWIPTKELVYRELVEDGGEAYDALTGGERELQARMRHALEEVGIEVVDTLPALRAQLVSGKPPYPLDQDGHPSAAGHEAVARQVRAAL